MAETKVYIPQGVQFDGPVTSLEEAVEREEKLQNEIKRLQGKCAEFARELSRTNTRASNHVQQILDLGKLLQKHKIDWRKEVVWTNPTAEAP